MPATALATPIPYRADIEQPEQDEAETSRGIDDTLRSILETTSGDYGHAVRSVHAKSHGLLEGELTVVADLPEPLAQGLFATPRTHRVILRFSTNPGDILDDDVTVPRGLAIKIFDVAGERLPGSENDTTQDFVMANGPAFMAVKTKDFLASLKPLAATTDKAAGAKKLLSAVFRGTEAALETVGLESAMLKQLGGQPSTHPLGDTYFSQTAFRFGDHVAKFSIAPASPNLIDRAGDTINASGRPNALREAIGEVMIEGQAEWELRVQLCTDLATMPVEDASKRWDEQESPYLPVARITVPAQPAWSPARSALVDDQLSFSPWHGLAAHRPLGQINRARRSAYAMSARFRGDFNGCPIHEPQAAPPLPA